MEGAFSNEISLLKCGDRSIELEENAVCAHNQAASAFPKVH